FGCKWKKEVPNVSLPPRASARQHAVCPSLRMRQSGGNAQWTYVPGAANTARVKYRHRHRRNGIAEADLTEPVSGEQLRGNLAGGPQRYSLSRGKPGAGTRGIRIVAPALPRWGK